MWARIATGTLGAWLILAPFALNFNGGPALLMCHATGPVVMFFAALSFRDATRVFRWFELLPAAWLMLCPWFLHYTYWVPILDNELVGLAIAILCWFGPPNLAVVGGALRGLWPIDTIREEQQEDGASYINML